MTSLVLNNRAQIIKPKTKDSANRSGSYRATPSDPAETLFIRCADGEPSVCRRYGGKQLTSYLNAM